MAILIALVLVGTAMASVPPHTYEQADIMMSFFSDGCWDSTIEIFDFQADVSPENQYQMVYLYGCGIDPPEYDVFYWPEEDQWMLSKWTREFKKLKNIRARTLFNQMRANQ